MGEMCKRTRELESWSFYSRNFLHALFGEVDHPSLRRFIVEQN